MKVNYDAETDILYISFVPSDGIRESEEVKPGIVLDFDANDKVVAIEIAHASEIMPLGQNPSETLQLEPH